MRLTQRLLLGSFLVISTLVVLVVVLSGQRLRAQLVDLTVEGLAQEARLVGPQWTPDTDAQRLADSLGKRLGRRVTLIDSTGRVVGDSELGQEALGSVEDHSTRPEVTAALRGSLGIDRRTSTSTGNEQLYVAVRAPLGVARVSLGTQQLDEIVGRARRVVLLSGAAALAAAMLLAVAFARTVSNPIVELRDVAQALAAGDLSRRPALSAPGEVGDLSAALHRMTEQLGSRLRALQANDALMSALIESLHEGIVAIDARRQVLRINEVGRRLLGLEDSLPFSADLLPRERVLREALADALVGEPTEQAEVVVDGRTLALTARPLGDGGAVLALFDLTATRRLETVRRDFVANVSHELKTPLTVIGGFAETMVTDDIPAEQRQQFADAIRANARRMQRIVDDLLDLSRIESGGWVPNPVAVDVCNAAADAIAPCQTAAGDRNVALDVDVHPLARTVFADPTALRQVIANMLDNAIRYSNRGGRVTVFTRPDDGGTWVGVRDTGIGIAPEHLPRIFERFYRVDAGRSRAFGGTGLGLSIVRHLVEAHGGRVRAESTPGRGTTVAAFFPAVDTTPVRPT